MGAVSTVMGLGGDTDWLTAAALTAAAQKAPMLRIVRRDMETPPEWFLGDE